MCENKEQKDGWPDGLDIIPFGARLDAVGRFLGGLLKYHAYEPTTRPRGASEVLDASLEEQPSLFDIWKAEGHQSVAADKLHEANLAGFGYVPDIEGRDL